MRKNSVIVRQTHVTSIYVKIKSNISNFRFVDKNVFPYKNTSFIQFYIECICVYSYKNVNVAFEMHMYHRLYFIGKSNLKSCKSILGRKVFLHIFYKNSVYIFLEYIFL